MPERYIDAILKFLADRDYQPLKPRQLARQLGVAEEEYGTFREAVKRLRDSGRIVLGARNAVMLPQMGKTVRGRFQLNPRGFGFLTPETPNAHGDLFVAPGENGGALTGDTVRARVRKRPRRGEMAYSGVIVEILERGQNRVVGTFQQAEKYGFVLPDGTGLTQAVLIRDVGEAGPKPGTKVVVEITEYPKPGQLPAGVIVERLGEEGELAAETDAVIRAHNLPHEWPGEALDEARRAAQAFDASDAAGREDLSGQTTITIDPPDARDFDDAISLTRNGDGTVTLGVHIADVSHFVAEGGALDAEACRRGNSVYFPRRVLPMLPEVLSNDVCSLQEGRPRLAKSAFITYDGEANVTATRLAETVIRSSKRLTYAQAQDVIDGKSVEGVGRKVTKLLHDLHSLARRIERRRREAGMLHLDLPEVQLVFDANNNVVDARPEDPAYTHTVIEMFMVEANEAVARALDRADVRYLRRVHPDPGPTAGGQLQTFCRACGHGLPKEFSREAIQNLLAAVRGKPESYAVNLAVLKTFQQAEYSPMHIGHFALASKAYCHFTSPIRRYPDLTVHRMVALHCRGRLSEVQPQDLSALTQLGEHCTATERRAGGRDVRRRGDRRDELRVVRGADAVPRGRARPDERPGRRLVGPRPADRQPARPADRQDTPHRQHDARANRLRGRAPPAAQPAARGRRGCQARRKGQEGPEGHR